jgi:hypothetical protein
VTLGINDESLEKIFKHFQFGTHIFLQCEG